MKTSVITAVVKSRGITATALDSVRALSQRDECLLVHIADERVVFPVVQMGASLHDVDLMGAS